MLIYLFSVCVPSDILNYNYSEEPVSIQIQKEFIP